MVTCYSLKVSLLLVPVSLSNMTTTQSVAPSCKSYLERTQSAGMYSWKGLPSDINSTGLLLYGRNWTACPVAVSSQCESSLGYRQAPCSNT